MGCTGSKPVDFKDPFPSDIGSKSTVESQINLSHQEALKTLMKILSKRYNEAFGPSQVLLERHKQIYTTLEEIIRIQNVHTKFLISEQIRKGSVNDKKFIKKINELQKNLKKQISTFNKLISKKKDAVIYFKSWMKLMNFLKTSSISIIHIALKTAIESPAHKAAQNALSAVQS